MALRRGSINPHKLFSILHTAPKTRQSLNESILGGRSGRKGRGSERKIDVQRLVQVVDTMVVVASTLAQTVKLPNVQQAAVLNESDLHKLGRDHPAYDAATNVLSSFEDAWAEFVNDKPLLLEGETAARIQAMREAAESVERSKRSVEQEFETHFATVSRGQKELESYYRDQIEKEKAQQANLLAASESISKELQSATESFERSQEWRRFTRGLGCLAEDYDTTDKLGPSVHALVLTDLTDPSSKDRFARASRVDFALARAHADVLEKEITGYQSLLPLLKRTDEDLRSRVDR